MSEEKAKIGYAFRIGAQVSTSGVAIDITGNFPVGCPDDVINLELDKWVNIFNRQRAKDMLVEEEKCLKNEKNQLEQLRAQLATDSAKETTKSAERMALQSLKQNVDRLEATIKARQEGIESLKALI